MHTTASDGTLSPEELVERVWTAGIRIMAVTDHDTMAGIERAACAAARRGIALVAGIEITSVHAGRDVHVLAYFMSESAPGLQEFLAEQRRRRVARAEEIARRLAALGAPIDLAALLQGSQRSGGKALARPQIARALVDAGHVASVTEAFDRFLNDNAPAYVPHSGASPADVVELIARIGGVSSLAHPGHTNRDEIIPGLVERGLHAIEAYHSSHDPATQARYVDMARHLRIAVSGGSDFHGDGTRRAEFFGITHLPPHCFAELLPPLRDVARIGATADKM
jgi:predicted metal-dependent phosphoesterase TrpH